MNNSFNQDSYHQAEMMKLIVDALLLSSKICEGITINKNICNNKLHMTISNIIESLKVMSNTCTTLNLDYISKYFSPLFQETNQFDFDIENQVWGLLKDLFRDPNKAKDINSKLKVIFEKMNR